MSLLCIGEHYAFRNDLRGKSKKENNIFTTHNYTLECDKTADKYKKTAQFGWKTITIGALFHSNNNTHNIPY